jgi:hypothetical protein
LKNKWKHYYCCKKNDNPSHSSVTDIIVHMCSLLMNATTNR